MDSLFEKITLYDFIGYTIPGCIFAGIMVICLVGNCLVEEAKTYKDFAPYLMLIFLVLGYVCGILLSEISRLFLHFCSHWKKDGGNQIVKQETLEQALRNSGLYRGGSNLDILKEHMKAMYSDIQTDVNYKRIHNYASAEVMYKNMAAALWLGSAVLLICRKQMTPFAIVCLFAGIIFQMRWSRFARKKKEYTVLWFVKKYYNTGL